MTENLLVQARTELRSLLAQCIKTGNVTLSSGRTTDFYFDGRLVTMNPKGLQLVSLLALDLIRGRFDAVGGPTAGADPMVAGIGLAALSEGTPLRTFFTRKEAKGHGMQRRVEGPALEAGDRVIIVDDTATSGGSLVRSARAVREETDAIVEAALVIVDREEGAAEALAEQGMELRTLFTRSELL